MAKVDIVLIVGGFQRNFGKFFGFSSMNFQVVWRDPKGFLRGLAVSVLEPELLVQVQRCPHR